MDKLQEQINNLQAQLDLLKSSNTIPRDIETAFTERLPVLKATGLDTATTQNIAISATPITIVVPAQPSGTLTVKFNGVIYNLLYK